MRCVIMQRVRNNFHPARRHTQKISRDIRKLRKQWRRDYVEIPFEELPLATRRAMQDTEQLIANWLKYHEEDEDD